MSSFFSKDNSEKIISELRQEIEKVQRNFSEQLAEQQNNNDKKISELQDKIARLENKNLSAIPEENVQTKVVSAKSSNQKLFVIHNGVETKMTAEEVFDSKFTDLKAVSYAVKGDFFRAVVKNFHSVSLIIGKKDCSEKLGVEFFKDKEIEMEVKIADGETIHDKIYLLSNVEKNLYRVVYGSANFTGWAFEKNFESIRVEDDKKIYDLYLQRFEFLKKNSKAFSLQEFDDISFEIVEEQKQSTKIFERNVGNYLFEDFKNEIENRKNFAKRKSGFEFLDDKQNIYPGLYVLGGAPAIGKTTFVWQLLNQLARQDEKDETCVFCSYETSAFDLILKSMAQENFNYYDKKNGYGYLSAKFIKENPNDQNVEKSINALKKTSDLKIFELSDETIDDLLERLQEICSEVKLQKKNPPIVAIDYLQIIPSGKGGAKSAVDDTVRKLKVFQRETNTTFFIISSFNRENYQQVSFKSFKESGGIEYTADVVWGLSKLKLTEKEVFDTNLKKNKKIEVRQIRLKCLKNRQGKTYDSYFEYYPENDFFKSVPEFPKIEKNSDGE